MTGREYRQDDRTEGWCDCGEPLSAMTTSGRGFCETHGWQYPDYRRPSDCDPGDETTDEIEAKHRTIITRRGSGWGYRCSCGHEPNEAARQRRVAEKRARYHEMSGR